MVRGDGKESGIFTGTAPLTVRGYSRFNSSTGTCIGADTPVGKEGSRAIQGRGGRVSWMDMQGLLLCIRGYPVSFFPCGWCRWLRCSGFKHTLVTPFLLVFIDLLSVFYWPSALARKHSKKPLTVSFYFRLFTMSHLNVRGLQWIGLLCFVLLIWKSIFYKSLSFLITMLL